MTEALQDAQETARYKIFLNKTDRHIIVLQFPHLERDRPLNAATGNKPLQIRLKPKNGLIELDVPLADVSHLNQRLAVDYGQALNQHKTMTNGAPVGVAGGFGATNSVRVKRQNIEIERPEALVADFDHSLQSGKALNFLTLTGKIRPFNPAEGARYLGNFHGEELHLTKVSAFCMLTVGLHHLDAEDLNEKAMRRAAQEEDAPPERAAIVGMQVKSSDETKTEESEWKRVLRELQEESWQKLEWIDEGEEQSFDIFHDRLFLSDREKSNRIFACLSRQQYADTLSALDLNPEKFNMTIKSDGTVGQAGDLDGDSDSSDGEIQMRA